MMDPDLILWNGSDDVFQASATFTGARPGWCFKLGVHGLGFYVDSQDESLESQIDNVTLDGDDFGQAAQLAILRLAWRGRFDIVSRVLLKSPDLWNARLEDGTTLLHLAARSGNTEFLHRALPESKLDVDVVDLKGRTPLMWAAGFGHLSAMRLFLNSNADPRLRDARGCTSLIAAASYKQHTAMLLLLAICGDDRVSRLADVDSKGQSVVHWSVLRGDFDAVKLLSRYRADLHQVDSSQNTLLHMSAQAEYGNTELLAFIIKHGVDPAQVNSHGQTCMDIARERVNPAVLPALEKALAECSSMKKDNKKCDQLDLEVGASGGTDKTLQKTLDTFFAMAMWIFCVSVTFVQYVVEVRPLAWQSWWLCWAAFSFESSLLVVLVLFVYAARCDPGKVPANLLHGPETFLRLLREGHNVPAGRLCTTTWVLKDLRTKYCKESGACIQEFDHFCDFIVQPIGKRNHRVFMLLLMAEPAAQCWYLFVCGMIVLHTQGMPVNLQEPWMENLKQEPFRQWMAMATYSLKWAIQAAWQYPGMVVVACIHVATLPWVLYTLAVQWFCIANNRTFNELQNWERYEHLWKEAGSNAQYSNAFTKGNILLNILDFWWFRERAEVGPAARCQVRELAETLREAGAK